MMNPTLPLLAAALVAASAPSASAAPRTDTAVLAGGCFWGMESVFEHVKGVTDVVSGYAGGGPSDANYDAVSAEETHHAEAVRIRYDPRQISYAQLLQIYFTVAHDPTQVNRQGPDTGSQYRSAIFVGGEAQRRVVDAYIAQLEKAKVFPRRIATEVVGLDVFYPAEAYHQNYAATHPSNAYIVINDAPKVTHLREMFPGLYRAP